MLLGIFKKHKNTPNLTWRRTVTDIGIYIYRGNDQSIPIQPDVYPYLTQMVDDCLAEHNDDTISIIWSSFYQALQSGEYHGIEGLLKLPEFTNYNPVLSSSNSLTDNKFSIRLSGWSDDNGNKKNFALEGGIITYNDQKELMRLEHWLLVNEIIAFSKRSNEERNSFKHRLAWGKIRGLATNANARLDDFLKKSIVLTPDRLNIILRKSKAIIDDTVIEIEPTFDNAPSNWLERFDSTKDVLDRYDINTTDGIIQVIISPEIKTVLKEIKRFDSRRVAGSRAQAFIVNPFATLGEDAKYVISEEQFIQAKEDAGINYERFSPVVEGDKIGLLIESADIHGPINSEILWLEDHKLRSFMTKLRAAINQNFQLLAWDGYDLEILGNAEDHLNLLEQEIRKRDDKRIIVSYSNIHDLSSYSQRIEGIGIEKPINSPHIKKEDEENEWFPPVNQPCKDTEEKIQELNQLILEAEQNGESTINLNGINDPITLDDAKHLRDSYVESLSNLSPNDTPNQNQDEQKLSPAKQRATLILRSNIENLDFDEFRRKALDSRDTPPIIPDILNPDYPLLPHQMQGLSWLQHLYSSRSEYNVRGAILADDMGLGKTFQILSFMGWLVEIDPNIKPMLIVAPVSLLENWKKEAKKFIISDQLSILTAYGDNLSSLMVPRDLIDERLRTEDGLVRFLKPDWIAGSKIVLTTYETLRDLEFSFALEHWSIIVCDEAQKIKNPAAMVTRSAKKQNVDFKIACTGTPVENTLADLWCLFDFVQPGLLGALNEFCDQYRRPIEAKSDEQKKRIEELREIISPQILRRNKSEVAKDLPKKIIVRDNIVLPLSSAQRSFYSSAIEQFHNRNDNRSNSPFKNHLGLIQYLRLICIDPRRHGLSVFKPDLLSDYRLKAPKIDWLLKLLAKIKTQNEKVIIFCEFREIQRLLQFYIEQEFKLSADIINGDTSASATHVASRQKRIDKFQSTIGFNIIILSPVAVGFGVNIQAANHVIHYTRTWNPAKEDQATDRAYRIGQTKDVYVYCPIVSADDFTTFDVKLDQLLSRKRELASDMLNGSGDLSPRDFEITDIVHKGDRTRFEDLIDLETALRMEWRHFEGLAAVLFNKMGFSLCYCTPGANDQGVDVVAINGINGALVQTKTSGKEGMKLGWETVKDVVGGEAYYKKKHSNVKFQKFGVTNQFFNDQAHAQAKLNNVTLIDQARLDELLKQYPISMIDIEKFIYTDWSYH